MVQTILADHT